MLQQHGHTVDPGARAWNAALATRFFGSDWTTRSMSAVAVAAFGKMVRHSPYV